MAGLAFAALCASYLPLHIWDLFRDDPVITPHSAAIIRVVVQVIGIGIGWLVWKRFKRHRLHRLNEYISARRRQPGCGLAAAANSVQMPLPKLAVRG